MSTEQNDSDQGNWYKALWENTTRDLKEFANTVTTESNKVIETASKRLGPESLQSTDGSQQNTAEESQRREEQEQGFVSEAVGNIWNTLSSTISEGVGQQDATKRQVSRYAAGAVKTCAAANGYDGFHKIFSLEDCRDEIEAIREENPEVDGVLEKLVPDYMDEDEFWCRVSFLSDHQQAIRRKALHRARQVISGGPCADDTTRKAEKIASLATESDFKPSVNRTSALEATGGLEWGDDGLEISQEEPQENASGGLNKDGAQALAPVPAVTSKLQAVDIKSSPMKDDANEDDLMDDWGLDDGSEDDQDKIKDGGDPNPAEGSVPDTSTAGVKPAAKEPSASTAAGTTAETQDDDDWETWD
eukprot:Clim_evm22s168 gene=Clim_evmTU22s168